MFRDWVKKTFDSLVDPDRKTEVAELSQLLHKAIAKRKQAFVLSDALGDRPYKQKHLEQAKINLYQKFLARAWSDGRVQSGERDTLAWAAKCLELPGATVRAINLEYARSKFAEALADAMDDGEITGVEARVLSEIAEAAGLSLKEFVKGFFRSEGEAFLRGIFSASIADNRLAPNEFERMVRTAERLGLSRAEVLAAIESQAVRFIERVLADAKEDDVLSADEEASLQWLLQNLRLPDATRDYIVAEMGVLRALTDVQQGKLPSLPSPNGVSLKAGELVHYHGRAAWQLLKLLKSGPRSVEHDGLLTITDSRLVFTSTTRSQAFSFRRLVGFDVSHGMIEIQVRGKPVNRFFCEGRSRIPGAIFRSAVEMANQTLQSQDESRRARHIPRDVRQRVWQRYGGRCAECGATSYLEFDHIVPVAKGGSNSDANVQLLCRKCNLTKSDAI